VLVELYLAEQYPPEFLEESHRLAAWLEELSA
jgi:hypothetical protein